MYFTLFRVIIGDTVYDLILLYTFDDNFVTVCKIILIYIYSYVNYFKYYFNRHYVLFILYASSHKYAY